MRLSPVLAVRQWLAKLHPPVPQTPRESQQLLRILEGSFRKHLDEVHPPPAQRQGPNLPPSDVPLISPDSSTSATHHYFNTLLNNPLLARPDGGREGKTSLTQNSVTLFAGASSDGSITIPLLRRWMNGYIQGFRNGEKVVEKDRFTSKLSSWIHTATPAMREAFLLSTEALDLAVQVAGLDEQEGLAWDWLRMIYQRDFVVGKEARDALLKDTRCLLVEDVLVSYFMRLAIRRGNLEDATHQFVEACKYRTDSGRAAARSEESTASQEYMPLENSWKRLAAAIVQFRQKHIVSEELFDRAMLYGLSWSQVPHFSKPVLLVYHPSSPSASSLSHNLRNEVLAKQFLSKQVGASRKLRRAMLVMILDAAQLSLEQGTRDQARFLLDFARKHYFDFLPAEPSKATSSLDVQIQDAQGELQAHAHHFAWV